MKNSWQKVLSFVLALVMVLGMVPVTAFADEVQQINAAALSDSMDGLSIAYPYNTETVQQTGTPASRFEALTFESARNEVESAQMILSPDFDITSFELTMGSLKNEKGNIIPSWAFEVYIQHYVTVSGSGNAPYWSDTYQMYNPTYSENGYDGTYPDALIPQNAAIAAGENKISAGKNGGIWVNLNVQNAAPGTYTGTATLNVNGTDMNIPVSVHIYDVSLPDQVHTKSSVGIWWDMVENGEGDIDRNLADTYFAYLVSKRIMPYDAWSLTRWDEAFADYAASYLAVSPEISSYSLFYVKNAEGSLDIDTLRTTLTILINKNISLAQSGSNVDLFAKAYLYFGSICDEPRDDAEYRAINNITAQLDSLKAELAPMLDAYPSLKASFMNLKHLVTGPNPTDKTYADKGSLFNSFIDDDYGNTVLTGDSYVYAPQYQWLNTESQRALYENEDELWWYGCCHPISPYPTYHINTSLVSARVESWMRYDYGIDGFVYSSVNLWGEYTDNGIQSFDYWNGYVNNGTPGDQILVLPGSDYGVYGPIGTIRIENIREGNEDYEYLWMLENEYGISDISTYTANLYSGVIADTDASIHYNNRKALLSKLEELSIAENGVTEIAPGNEGFVRGQEIKPSTNLTIELGNTEEVATLSFDYKVTSGTFNISLNPDWDNAFGYFAFNANGNVDPYDGITVEKLDDGYIRVTFKLAALTKYSGNPSKALSFLYIRGAWTDATGYIDNVQYVLSKDYVEPLRGQEIAPATNLTIELDNTEELGTLSFDYKVTSGTFNISLNSDWDNAFGYFAFNADGNVDPYDGVTLETLEDGYTRVTFDLEALKKVNGKPSKALSFLYIRGAWTDATGYIDNVQTTVYTPTLEFDGGAFAAGTDLIVELDNSQPITKMSFDYKITSGDDIVLALMSDWDNYYGYYAFTPNGNKDANIGFTTEELGNGYIRVFVDVAALEVRNGDPSSVLTMIYIWGRWTTASGVIENIRINEAALLPSRGQKIAPSTNLTIELDNTEVLDTLSFDYKVTSGTFNISLNPDWDNAFGYFAFDANGNVDPYDGVTLETLEDGYTRVTFDLAALTKYNGNPGKALSFLYIRGAWSDAAGYIDNIQYTVKLEESTDPPATEPPVTEPPVLVFDGGEFIDDQGLNIGLNNSQAVTKMSFDYKVTSGTDFVLAFRPDWGENYYGNFVFNTTGSTDPYSGITTEALADGYVRVFVDVAALHTIQGSSPSNVLTLITVHNSWGDASGVIENIRINEAAEQPSRGQQIVSRTDLTIELGNTEELGTLSFDYKVLDGTFNISLNPDWDNKFGFFAFNANGNVDPYDGVTVEDLDDGYKRVTFDLNALTKTEGTPSKVLSFVYIRGAWTDATGYIDNVQYTVAQQPEVPAYRGQYFDATQNPTFSVNANNGCKTISFEYCITSGNQFVAALMPDWDNYYGYYGFTATGMTEPAAGVSTEILSDGYIRVTFDMEKLVAGQGNPGVNISHIYFWKAWSDATGYIDNITWEYGCEHSYETVSKEPTFTEVGGNVHTCSKCGNSYVTEEIPAYTFQVKQWNVALADDIRANFHLNVDSRLSDAKIIVMGKTYDLSALNKTEKGDYELSVNVAAAQMTDDISIQIVYGEVVSEELTYSIRQYAEKILTGTYSNTTKELVKAMLHYGAMAQTYFGYNTGNLANKDYVNTEAVEIPAVDTSKMVSGSADGIRFYGASLVFESKVAVRFYFVVDGDINSYTFSTGTPVAKNGTYYIEVPGINPQDYATDIVLTVNDTLTVTYSPLTYISRKAGADNALANLVKAMYAYHLAAKAYLNGVETLGVSYSFTGNEADRAGYAEGTVAIANAEAGQTYEFYWADKNGKLSGYRALGSVSLTAEQTTANLTVAENTMIPAGADRLIICITGTDEAAGTYLLGEKANTAELETKFAVISDVHTNYNQGENYLLDALEQFESEGVSYIIVTGDIGESDSDYAKYVSAVEKSNFSGLIFASIGNHDQTETGRKNFKTYAIYDGSTKTWVGIDNAPAYFAGNSNVAVELAGENLAYYVVTFGENAFIFMDQELTSTGNTPNQDNFSKEQLNFVEDKLYQYSATHNLFIIEHAPVEQLKIGDKFDPGYGGAIQLSAAYPNNQRFVDLLMEYTEAIWLSGHTHVQYDTGIMYVDKYYDASENLTDTAIAHAVHVSSLAQPRWYEGSSMKMPNDFSAASQGYVCYQYADDIVFEARSFKNYTPDSITYNANLFINEVNAVYSWAIPLETLTHDAPSYDEEEGGDDEVTLVDYAVAENGIKRAGNPTWEDTADGLKVTFAAASDRFEIKTGDQTDAFAKNCLVQFKIKTDLTSFDLGGCNYSGSRKTYIQVNLAESGDLYTVTDLGDGWKLVTVPMSNLGHDSVISEFAIRFYNTNVAGTFTLKELYIAPEMVEEVAIDYAVAENGNKRAGSPTWEDTDDGLKVTFAAKSDRFEIKTGDQTEAFTNGYTVQFKIKTDLTSFDLGGSNYSGSRKTYIQVNLAASGEQYTVTDLGDGWRLVTISMTNLCHNDIVTNFAIRFYNTNAAGTFTLKELYIAPEKAEENEPDAGRVMITADVHVSADDASTLEHLRKTLTYAKNNGVNMLIFNGDTVNVGNEADYAALDSVFTEVFGSPEQANVKFIFNMGNHEFYPTSACAHEETDYAVQFSLFAQFASKWSDFTAEQGSIYLTEVNGISYIVAAPSDDWTYEENGKTVYCAALGGYHENDIALIDSLIAQATAANPGEPVYLLSHHPWGETYGGASYGMPETKVVTAMKAVMEKYPHLVNVTSHTHFSSLHERSFAQDKWTTINTGMHTYGKYVDIETDVNGEALNYVNIDGRRYTSTDPEGKALHGATHFVWNVTYGEDSFTAKVFNMATETAYSYLSYTVPYGITAENKGEKFAYELSDRTAPTLTWSAEDVLTVELVKNGSAYSLQLTFNDTDQFYATEGYRIKVVNAATGETLKTVLWASRFWAAQEKKDSYEITVDGVTQCSEYKVTVEAIDFYGNYSAAKLEATVQYSGAVQTETALLLQKCNGSNANCSARDYSNIYFATVPFTSVNDTLTLVVKTDCTSITLRGLSDVSGVWEGSAVSKNLEDLGDGWKTATWTLSEILKGNDAATMNGFKITGLVEGMDILMKDILINNQTDWIGDYRDNYHGVITQQQIEVAEEEEVNRGQQIVSRTNLTIELGNTEELATLSFDYKVTSGTFNISLNPDWDNAFGYFAFDANGNVDPYDGVTLETLEDGYTRVTFDLAALTKYNGNPGKALSFLYIRGAWSDATGYIDNVQYTTPTVVFDGGAFTAGSDLTVTLNNSQPVTKMSFDYKITSGDDIVLALRPDWDNYYGYYAFTPNGNKDANIGFTTEELGNGYIRVFVDVAALELRNGDPSSVLTMIYIWGRWTTASGVIENIRINEAALLPSRGQKIAPSTNLTIELGNTEELETVSFDYKVTSGTFNISLNPDWDNAFGYFAFDANGNVDPYDGVTLETLEDGYTRVTFDLAALTKYNGNPGKALSFLYMRGAWTDATGYIDNIQFA